MTISSTPKSARIDLAFLGFVSLLIGAVCMIDCAFVYSLSPLTSISQSATTGIRAGMVLPFALGLMALYCIGYTGYCTSERIVVRIMAAGFAAVALQPCNSIYIDEEKVGILGLHPIMSDIVHCIGAAVGFGLMVVWIAFFFTRHGGAPTRQKIIRNKIYTLCSGAMIMALTLFIVGQFVDMGPYITFIAEEFILIPAGIAIIVKSGLVFADKN